MVFDNKSNIINRVRGVNKVDKAKSSRGKNRKTIKSKILVKFKNNNFSSKS